MTDYSKLKVAELKELVKERGIVAPGLKLKQQFVDALEAADTETENVTAEAAEEQAEQAPDASAESAELAEQEAVEEVDTAKDAKVEEAAVADDADGMDVNESSGAAKQTEDVKAEVDELMGDAVDATHTQEQEADAENNKRKRRSPTPPLPEESAIKKLKTAQEVPSLPKADEDVKHVREVEDEKNEPPQDDAFMTDVTSTAPSQHAATRALYIRNLVRPLQPNVLREHLLEIATPSGSDIDASIVEGFHLDKLRSHALTLFASISAASRARSALHDQVWPAEPMRKPLFADFIPEDKFQEWVDLEISRERENLRWEVVYNATTTEDGSHDITASIQEIPAARQTNQSHMRNDGPPPTGPRAALTGEGMPNAPSGPRSIQAAQPQNIPEPIQSKSFSTLDASYKFTETKPKLYWQPVHPELAEKRQDELEKETSRAWDGNMGAGEMRRYTFEDGDKIVDGGVDWGKFGGGGHHAGPPPRRGGGRDFGGRRGRGGGYRGGGGGYGGGGGGYRGDSYRGGGARW